MNAIQVKSAHQIVREISHAEAETETDTVLEKLYKHFLLNNFSSRLQFWTDFKAMYKTDTITLSENVKKKKIPGTELKTQEMLMNDELFCYPLLEAAKLDTAMRLSVKAIATNNSADRRLAVHGVEDALLRLKSEEQK